MPAIDSSLDEGFWFVLETRMAFRFKYQRRFVVLLITWQR